MPKEMSVKFLNEIDCVAICNWLVLPDPDPYHAHKSYTVIAVGL